MTKKNRRPTQPRKPKTAAAPFDPRKVDRHTSIRVVVYFPKPLIKALDDYISELDHPPGRGQVVRDAVERMLGKVK